MKARRLVLRGILPLPLFAAIGIAPVSPQAPPVDASIVQRALSNELAHANSTQHPMRYQLRKSSPRYTSTKNICETKDGAVARLISVNDKPLSAEVMDGRLPYAGARTRCGVVVSQIACRPCSTRR